MTNLSHILPVLTFVIAVVALVLALWPVVADAPWEYGVTSAELSEIPRAEKETSSEEKEAERKAKCETAVKLYEEVGPFDMAITEVVSTIIENNCLSSP